MTPEDRRKRILVLQQKILNLEEVAKSAIRQVEREISELQRDCDHQWQREPDPAGGPASYWCQVCERWR